MHVLILCEYGTINGGERSLLSVLDHRPDDLSVTVLAPPDGRLRQSLKSAGAAHIPFSVQDDSGKRLTSSQIIESLRQISGRLSPDCIHANSLSMARITGTLAGHVATPCTGHLRDIIRLSPTAVRHINSNVRLAAVSNAARDFHVAQGVAPERVIVLHNGIDGDQWRPREKSGQLHRELHLPPNALIALSVGQIGMRKGIDVVVEAAIRLSDAAPHLHFVFAGERTSVKAESIAYEEALHVRAVDAGLRDRVHWLGYREDVDQLLNDADLFVHAARQEPFGRVLLEAAACALPIIATRVGGTAEMLMDGESALLIAPDDAQMLAGAIQGLVDDPVRRAGLGSAARRLITAKFDIRERARDLYQFWSDVCL